LDKINQMKKLLFITACYSIAIGITGCGGAHGDDPGHAYMPDMYYSRAYEAYGYNNNPEDHNLKSRGAFYNAMPVPGTIARGESFPFEIPAGDSGYKMAATYTSPMQNIVLTPAQTTEAERIYLINCAICHGPALDGNGPLWKGGEGPFPAAPRNLKDDYTKKLGDGQIYHVITYGKGLMGSYASQVKPEQRWWIIKYIRSKQGPATPAADSAGKKAAVQTGAATSKTDSTKK
jgi:mono/diheme cytochrome c family protein